MAHKEQPSVLIVCTLALIIGFALAWATGSANAAQVDRRSTCNALARVVIAADKARAARVPQAVALAQLEALDDPVARSLGGDAIWYTYVANADGRTPRAELAARVRRACLLRD